jgi:hypothetical protein
MRFSAPKPTRQTLRATSKKLAASVITNAGIKSELFKGLSKHWVQNSTVNDESTGDFHPSKHGIAREVSASSVFKRAEAE